jgi:ribosome-associated translation inhibitor RaiA/cold shock CspA family protein
MQIPLKISYRHTEASEALNALIQSKADDLDAFYSRITGCRVTIDWPGGHHRKGKGAHFRVRIELSVPEEVLVVARDPVEAATHENAFLAVNEAFHALRRQLEDYVRRRREGRKERVGPAHGRITRLEDGFGFLETPDGREIYFNLASVLNGGRVAIGAEVRFSEEQGDNGPQASTLEVVGKDGHHEFPAEGRHPADS